ncbi:MAG: family 20 glycosylhydrolase [Bacteroidales bacterium]|nr:family 20 glycosylhydrolase [Bacteroidales bacterium]
MSWRGVDGGIKAAQMKHHVVMTPTSHCYFDYYQSNNKEIEPPAFGGFLDYKMVYAYEPVPAGLTAEESGYILGAQGNMWSEFLTTESHTEYMALPRLTALSEVVWTPSALKNEESFLRRLNNLYNIYSARKYNYHVPAPVGLIDTMIFIHSASVELKNPLPMGQVRFTTNGTPPDNKSDIYTAPINITATTNIKAALFLNNGKTSGIKAGFMQAKSPDPSIILTYQRNRVLSLTIMKSHLPRLIRLSA